MKTALLTTLVIAVVCTSAFAEKPFGFEKLSDEISFFANTNDEFDTQGRTLQVVAINNVKIGTWFQIEFTGDFNWDMTPGEDYDYYIEVGVVKPIWKNFSLNYQRVYGTFIDDPVNQWGIRFRL